MDLRPGGAFRTEISQDGTEFGPHITATAMHRNVADRDQHEQLGFHDGWGTVSGSSPSSSSHGDGRRLRISSVEVDGCSTAAAVLDSHTARRGDTGSSPTIRSRSPSASYARLRADSMRTREDFLIPNS